MLVFRSYDNKDLQHFLQILNQFESSGITDIRFIRERLYKHLYRPQKIRPVRPSKKLPLKKCPKCASAMFQIANEESLVIFGCRDCRYSEVVN